MEAQLQQLKEEALQKIEASQNVKELNDVRVAYLGKKGPITDLIKRNGETSCRRTSENGGTCKRSS